MFIEQRWLFELKDRIPNFLEKLYSQEKPGFFHYSLSGDLYNPNIKWGLGNTVFAVKIYYTLNLLGNLPWARKKAIIDFIKSFQKINGTIYDSLIRKKTFFRDKLLAIKNLDINNFLHQQTIRAETRQAISALKLLKTKPDFNYQKFPKTENQIKKYLNKLNWFKPWGAGSHFSHLIFFLRNSNLNNKSELIDYTINWVNKLQNPETGSWYRGNPSLEQKINSAMKIITGLKVANQMNFRLPEKLIDLLLSAINNKHACDNFNLIYVLYYASEMTKYCYRAKEIQNFTRARLRIYENYYHPIIGGFSFSVNKANEYYYGAKITKGLNEPDIHGTVMFLWGLAIISKILKIELDFNEQIP